MACPNCGSWSVRADRSLSGRMVCGRCGEPLGIGRGKGRARGLRAPRRGTAGRWPCLLGLTALVAVSAVLAGLAERWPRTPSRPDIQVPAEPWIRSLRPTAAAERVAIR